MILSISVAGKFKQINYNLELHRGMIMPETFWIYYRKCFQELTELVTDVDDVLGNLILLSFSNNLYFVCVKLLHSMELVFCIKYLILYMIVKNVIKFLVLFRI